MKVKVLCIHAKYLQIRQKNCDHLASLFSRKLETDPISFSFHFIDQEVQDDALFDFKGPSPYPFQDCKRLLNTHERSNAQKHMSALKIAASDDKFDFHLIIEDDCVCQENVVSSLYQICSTYAKSNWQILFLGLPHRMHENHIETNGVVSFYSKHLHALPLTLCCCDSYLIPKASAQVISDSFNKPFRYQTNIEFAYRLYQHPEIQSAYSVPQIFVDGSKIGFAVSAMTSNNKLIFNNEYLKFYANYQNLPSIPKEIESNPHPDVQYLVALYLIHKTEYRKAEILLKELYKIYTDNFVIFDNKSEFLLNFAGLYRYIQDE